MGRIHRSPRFLPILNQRSYSPGSSSIILAAPIALYPDPLLGEVLAASTYPFEIAEAEQWVQDHSNWKPSKLMKEAKKQNWDPSIQGPRCLPAGVGPAVAGRNLDNLAGQHAFPSRNKRMLMQAVLQQMRAQARKLPGNFNLRRRRR